MAKTIYEVTFEGEYFTPKGNKDRIKHYELTVKMDDSAKQMGFLSAFVRALKTPDGQKSAIKQMMKAKYPDYQRYRTHMLTNTVDITNQGKPVKELRLMNRDQIIRVINAQGYGIEPDLYPTAQELRQAILDYRALGGISDDPEKPSQFQLMQEKRRKRFGATTGVINSINELNKPEQTTNDASKPWSDTETQDNQEDDNFAEFAQEDTLNNLVSGIDDALAIL